MISSLYISVTGMSAFSEKISIISNNVANVETTSYKSSSVYFSDMLTEAISRSYGGVCGCGVEVQQVNEIWKQGSITSTNTPTNLAINGSGMFVVRDPSTGMYYYTRDGSFQFDVNGALKYSNGMDLQGYPINDNGDLGSLSNIQIPYQNSAPKATSEIFTSVNLNAAAETGDTFSTTTNIYDSLGNEIPLTITYTKSANTNEWDWTAEIPSEYGTLAGSNSGTLVFDAYGQLVSGADPVFDLQLTSGASNQSITWNLYDQSGDTNGALTQYSSDSVMNDKSQDGCSAGELTSVSMNEEGKIIASYSNGETRALYQIALADFNCYQGLEKTDGNLYIATSESGEAILGAPGIGGMGSISPGSLEMSNVDLATEMAGLLTAQSAYQANSRAFSITNEVLQTLVNLK